MVKKCLSRMSGKLSRTVLRRGKGSNPFSLVDFTSKDYLELLKENQVQVSMDGKGRATDNSRTERFFRALKYENIYLNEYRNPRELRKGISEYIEFYNTDRPHQSLDYEKPEQIYDQSLLEMAS